MNQQMQGAHLSRGPRPLVGRLLWVLGGMVFLAFLVGAVSIGLGGAALGLVIALAIALANRIHRRARRHTVSDAHETLSRDSRLPVLYLRPFEHDVTTSTTGGFGRRYTEEEQLAFALDEIGPVVAVGRPKERLPMLGASRLYIEQDDWQNKVSELFSRCRLAVLRVGESEGLQWELDYALSHLPPQRLIILIPRDHTSYTKLKERLAIRPSSQLPTHLPLSKKPLGSLAGVIFFQRDWTPQFVPFKGTSWRSAGGYRAASREIAKTLRPVWTEINTPWRPKRYASAGYVASLGMLVLLAPIMLYGLVVLLGALVGF